MTITESIVHARQILAQPADQGWIKALTKREREALEKLINIASEQLRGPRPPRLLLDR